jgi:hypothetical protein
MYSSIGFSVRLPVDMPADVDTFCLVALLAFVVHKQHWLNIPCLALYSVFPFKSVLRLWEEGKQGSIWNKTIRKYLIIAYHRVNTRVCGLWLE